MKKSSRKDESFSYLLLPGQFSLQCFSNFILSLSIQTIAHLSTSIGSFPNLLIIPSRSISHPSLILPIQNNNPPNPRLTPKWPPKLHAIRWRYLGEKTVQMKRWVRSIVHASMVKNMVLVMKSVSSAMWLLHIPSSPSGFSFAFSSYSSAWLPSRSFAVRKDCVDWYFRSSITPPEHQNTIPAQLPRNVSKPTVKGLYDPMPL